MNYFALDDTCISVSGELHVINGIEYRFQSYEVWDSESCLDWYYLRVFPSNQNLRKRLGYILTMVSSREELERAKAILIEAESAEEYSIIAHGVSLLRAANMTTCDENEQEVKLFHINKKRRQRSS